jgi:hypothetical protein
MKGVNAFYIYINALRPFVHETKDVNAFYIYINALMPFVLLPDLDSIYSSICIFVSRLGCHVLKLHPYVHLTLADFNIGPNSYS